MLQVYVEVSKNHGYSIGYVMKHKFDPEIKLLIMYYNNLFREQENEYKRFMEEQEKQKEKIKSVDVNGRN